MYTRLIQGFEAMESDVQAVSASAASKLRLMVIGLSPASCFKLYGLVFMILSSVFNVVTLHSLDSDLMTALSAYYMNEKAYFINNYVFHLSTR